jgi:hypothetical protein
MVTICTRQDVKTALGISDAVDDLRIDVALAAATAQVQEHCNRVFVQESTATARVYVAQSAGLVQTDDISTTVGLIVQTDPGANGVFDQTWQTADYQLEPLNGLVNGAYRPFTTIRAIRSLYFPSDYGQALVRITARWGWSTIPDTVKQATIIQTIHVFKSVDAPFGATPFAETGILRLRTALHPTAVALLEDYRLNSVMVA